MFHFRPMTSRRPRHSKFDADASHVHGGDAIACGDFEHRFLPYQLVQPFSRQGCGLLCQRSGSLVDVLESFECRQ
jgi:hypothetical protein